MPTPYLARSLATFRRQIDEAFPTRSKAADGWIADARHRANGATFKTSQHIENRLGAVCGIDITEDLAVGLDCLRLLEELDAADDPRFFYAIHDGQIENSDDSRTAYTGANKHPGHLHLSVRYDRPALYDDDRPWNLPMLSPTPAAAPPAPTTRKTMYLTRDDEAGGAMYLWTDRGPIQLRSAEEVEVFQGLLATPAGGRGFSHRWHRVAAHVLARTPSTID